MVPISLFDTAWEFTKKWEGGYSNDPQDPGGETNYGISKKAHPDEDIKNLTEEHAKEIYRKNYWNVFTMSNMDGGMACAVFDSAVNCGVARTVLWLDGSKDYKDLLEARRLHYEAIVKKNPKLSKYLRGWQNRLKALHMFIETLKEQKT